MKKINVKNRERWEWQAKGTRFRCPLWTPYAASRDNTQRASKGCVPRA